MYFPGWDNKGAKTVFFLWNVVFVTSDMDRIVWIMYSTMGKYPSGSGT